MDVKCFAPLKGSACCGVEVAVKNTALVAQFSKPLATGKSRCTLSEYHTVRDYSHEEMSCICGKPFTDNSPFSFSITILSGAALP